MAKIAITADLHLTDDPRDEYRWEIFDYLRSQADARGLDRIILAGDLTDAKDRHPATLVHRLSSEIARLSQFVNQLDILLGNHDYVDPGFPFFSFLGSFAKINFIDKPTTFPLPGHGLNMVYLPHTRAIDYWADMRASDTFKEPESLILFHQCIDGAKTPLDFPLAGVPLGMFSQCHETSEIVGGDIHTPQNVGRAVYTGSPYPIAFGDMANCSPRYLIYDTDLPVGKRLISVVRASIRKSILTVSSTRELERSMDIDEGDQIKVRYRLIRSDYGEWPKISNEIQRIISEKGAILHGAEVLGEAPVPAPTSRPSLDDDQPAERKSESHGDTLEAYGEVNNLEPPVVKAGRKILDTVI